MDRHVEAGPSRVAPHADPVNGTTKKKQRTSSWGHVDVGELSDPSALDEQPPSTSFKRRSRTACLQCRSRRSRCGTSPPNPCPHCLELGLICQWPVEDGRSATARRRRTKGLGVGSERGVNVDGPLQNPAALLAMDGVLERDDVNTGASDWLNSLLVDPGSYQPIGADGAIPGDLIAGPGAHRELDSQQPPFEALSAAPVNPSSAFVDSADLVRAVTSRLAVVEEATPQDDDHGTSGSYGSGNGPHPKEGRMVRITWWRPHGKTAIAPGLKRISLKVRIDPLNQTSLQSHSPSGGFYHGSLDNAQEVIGANGMPSLPIMRHLLDVFFLQMGSYFPSLERTTLERQLVDNTGSVFLFNCIASVAARFSTDPVIALPSLQPHAYGDLFTARAKALLGSMMSVPSKDTVAAFLLLALTAAGSDSESEVWMFIGMAARMSLDLGLHTDPPEDSDVSANDRRLNRLLFWSILLLDHALSFGVGRPTTFPMRGITQILPTEEDIHPEAPPGTVRSAFPYAANLMRLFGPLINALNGLPLELEEHEIRQVQAARAEAITEYSQLPQDMQWVMQNLQAQSRTNQSSIFVFLHLWVHTILASEYLTGHNNRPKYAADSALLAPPAASRTPTTFSTEALWRNSARTIGDILVLCELIDPRAYVSLPLVNQCFYVAGCCNVTEIEQSRARLAPPDPSADRIGQPLPDLSHAILTTVARTNIATLQRGLENLTKYWCGIAWIAGSLAQRVEGLPADKLDLVGITEKMATFVSLPDAGLADREARTSEEGERQGTAMRDALDWGSHHAPVDVNFTAFNDSNVPGFTHPDPFDFDFGILEGSGNVTEQHMMMPQTFDISDWFGQA